MHDEQHKPSGSPGSVSRLIPDLLEGDRQAMQKLWERYFQPLVRLARSRSRPARRIAGSEDIALEAFLEFCACLARPDAGQRFPHLQTREQVWKLLACFTVPEIARQLDCSPSTVERKLRAIRSLWKSAEKGTP